MKSTVKTYSILILSAKLKTRSPCSLSLESFECKLLKALSKPSIGPYITVHMFICVVNVPIFRDVKLPFVKKSIK